MSIFLVSLVDELFDNIWLLNYIIVLIELILLLGGFIIKNTFTNGSFNQTSFQVKFTAIKNVHWKTGSVLSVCRDLGNFFDNMHTFNNLTKNYMFAIKMWTLFESNEELAAISSRTSISHG